jgi:hypothetical protein
MSAKRLAIIACAIALQCAPVAASLINASYSWSGAKGWTASGAIRYDDSIMYPAAAGPSWGAFNTGIEYLDLAIYDNKGLLKGAWVEILSGVVQYNTLRITLDTSAAIHQLAAGSKLDMGTTADLTRPHLFAGNIGTGKTLIIGWNQVIADSGPGSLTFTPVADPPPTTTPTPATAALLLLGVALAAASRGRYARV